MCIDPPIQQVELSRRGLLGLGGGGLAAVGAGSLLTAAPAAAVPPGAMAHRHSSRVCMRLPFSVPLLTSRKVARLVPVRCSVMAYRSASGSASVPMR